MTFFNTKEEVLEIELTAYGKHLLSTGKWKPVYYEFYDDDVVYDTEYVGHTEKQEETQQRIKETSRPKTFYSFEGAETRFKEERKRNLAGEKTSLLEKRKTLSNTSLPLANSSIEQENLPSWNVKILNGQIDYVTSSAAVTGLPNTSNIIQLQDVEFKTFVSSDEKEKEKEINFMSDEYEDGTFIAIKEDYLLVDLKEENVDLSKEYFDLEIFLIESGSNGKEIELPLKFSQVENNKRIYEEEDDNFPLLGVLPVDSVENEFVEFYFDLQIDREIESNILCKHLSKVEIENLKAKDGYLIDCEERESMQITSDEIISNVTQDDLDRFEDC